MLVDYQKHLHTVSQIKNNPKDVVYIKQKMLTIISNLSDMWNRENRSLNQLLHLSIRYALLSLRVTKYLSLHAFGACGYWSTKNMLAFRNHHTANVRLVARIKPWHSLQLADSTCHCNAIPPKYLYTAFAMLWWNSLNSPPCLNTTWATGSITPGSV